MTRVLQGLLVLVTLAIGVSFASAAGRREVRTDSPDEFLQEVSGRIVTVMLKDGRHFKAQISEVGVQSVRLKVTDSKVGGAFTEGSEREVSYSDLGTVSYFKQQGKTHWVLPLVVGGAGALAVGAVFGYCGNEGGRNCDTLEGTTAGVAAGATALAAYGGYRADRVEVQLHVSP
jgi:hypothetical protein